MWVKKKILPSSLELLMQIANYFNEAVTLSANNKVEEAIPLLEKAWHYSKGYNNVAKATVLRALGVAYSRIGNFQRAEYYHTKATAYNKKEVLSWCALAVIKKHGEKSQLHKRLLKLFDLNITDIEKQYVYFALGKVFDDKGDYDKAFEYYFKGNELGKQSYPFETWDQCLNEFDELLNRSTAEHLAELGIDDSRFIFIVGMPRSGTTLLDSQLAKHKDIISKGEQIVLPSIKQSLDDYSGEWFYIKNILRQPHRIKELAQRYVDETVVGEAKYYINKVPNNFTHLVMIQALLPNAKIIHCKRHPIDTGLSCYFQNFHDCDQEWSFDMDGIVRYTNIYRDVMSYAENLLLDTHVVQYEDLVSNQDTVLNGVFDFLNLSPADCTDISGGAINTASIWQARQPVYQSSIERWKNYEKHITPLLALEQ